ncbi:MAG TPA: zinc ribbon domain-containing protein [Candidatus Norongarragalinales archaeon]|nr:zinc ribbon domain-containing protein [Candidatus Norongarragalinales archaeon]
MDYLAYLFYLYYIAGSVTLGYLLLRLTYPEVRTLSPETKLGAAGISGGLLAVASLVIDYAFDGKLEVLTGSGLYAIIIFLLFLLSFVTMKLYFMFSRPEFLTVGMPMSQPTITLQIEHIERKPEPEVRETIIPKKTSDMQERELAEKKASERVTGKDELKVVSDEHVILQKKENFFSKIVHVFSPKANEKKVALEDMQKAAMVTVSPLIAGQASAPPSAPLGKAAIMAPPYVARENPPSGIVIEKPAFEKPPQENEAQAKGALPSIAASSTANASADISIPFKDDKKKGNLGPEEPRKSYLAMVDEIIKDEKKPDAGKGGDDIEIPTVPQNGQQRKPLDVSGHERLYAAARFQEADAAASQKGFVKEKFETDPKQRAEQIKKATETEAEAILQDILPKDVLVQEVVESPSDGHRRLYEKVQAQQRGVATKTASELPPGAMVHRRYLVRSGESGQTQGVSVVGNAAAMQGESFDSMVSDVYTQLKSTKTEGIAKNLKVTPPKGSSSKQAPKSEITFEDLLGDKPQEKKEDAGSGGSSVMSQLAGLSQQGTQLAAATPSLGSAASESAPIIPKSSIDFVKIQAEKGMGCPTCSSKNTKIIFCPYCGTGMCANCSPSIKIKEGGFVYTCPKCKEDVDIRKKAAEGAAGKGLMGMGSPG